MSDDPRKPIKTPFGKTVSDLEEQEPDGLGQERLEEDIARTEEDEDA